MTGAPDALLEAATAVLGHDPAATMADVARAAGVGRATLYRRYATRDALLQAIRVRALTECRQALGEVAQGDLTASDELAAALRALFAVVDRYRVLAAAPRLDRGDPAQRSLADDVERPLAAIVQRGVAAGEFRDAVAPELVASMATSLLTAARRGVVEAGVDPGTAEAAVVRAVLSVVRPAGTVLT